ncbi:glucosyl hydrolase [Coralliovum pocilloporae]|uniref:glucosyl hydrolase n=1 Tax=Coralliovum pocilloporae TaxID=3066369 RepID=UPI003307C012
MQWKKHGLVYGPDGSLPWAQSHAMIPTPFQLNKDVVRVFTSFCDASGMGRPGYVDISARDPMQVLDVCQTPLIDVGKPGTFDENGAVVCSVTRASSGDVLMFYVGFELGTKIRYRLLTGLAISHDGGQTFIKHQETPVLERSTEELFFRCGPYAKARPDGNGVDLWYVAGSEWVDVEGKDMPVYDVRHAFSPDGKTWPSSGNIILEITDDDEHGYGRPCVMPRPGGGYRMFVSVRKKSVKAYRLAYAESEDGISWQRADHKLNLDVSESGFDSDAIMYATPFEMNGKLYVFYNGNNFGRDGFALAELIEE